MAPHVLDLLSSANPITQTAILEHLEARDIVQLLATCRTLRYVAHSIWNVNRSLRRFVDDPLKFRSLMARYNAVVSGSHALQFFSGVKWKDSDLDVYMTGQQSLEAFARHLSEKEGYIFSAYSWQSQELQTALQNRESEVEAFLHRTRDQAESGTIDETASELAVYTIAEIDGVFNFHHSRKAECRIQLISAKVMPLNAILADYYASHIYNFFTWNKAYSLYPYHTVRHQAYRMHNPTYKSEQGIEKYEGRGFGFHRYGEKHTCVKNCPFRPHRRIGDKYCWSIDLDTAGVDVSKVAVPPDVIETYTWGLKMHKSWWNKDLGQREFLQSPWIQTCYTFETKHFRYPRIVDCHTESWGNLIEAMKRTYGGLGGYSVYFPGAAEKDWVEKNAFNMDPEFRNWYDFWEKSIMPNDNIWKWQYPCLS